MHPQPAARRSRLATAVIGPSILLAALITAAVLVYGGLLARRQARDQAQHTGLLVAHLLIHSAETYRSHTALEAYVATLASDRLVQHIVVAAGDPLRVIASSHAGEDGVLLANLDDHALVAHMADVANGRVEDGLDRSLFQDRMLARRIRIDARLAHALEAQPAVIGIRVDPESFGGLETPLLLAFVASTIAGVALVVAVAIGILRRRVLVPLDAIGAAVRRRRLGVRGARVAVDSTDEFADVAQAINSAFDALDAQLTEIRKLAVIATQTDVSAMITDPEGVIEWVNDGFTRITGYTLDEARGRRPNEFLHGATTDTRQARQVWVDLRAGKRASIEMHAYAKGGRRFTAAVRAFPVLDAAGAVTSCVLLADDVTENRATRRAIVSEMTRFQQDLAFDLHDHVGGDLGGLAFRAKVLAEQLAAEGRPEAAAANDLTAALGAVADRTRALSGLLAPTSRQQGGLENAMRRLCESARSYCTAVVTLRMSETLPELDSWQASQVHLIAQESLRNAIRHGSPTRIHVNLSRRPDILLLRITSDQQPWNPADHQQGLGLRIVRHRAETLNASVTIRVRPSGVTQVRVVVPLAPQPGA